MSNKCQFTTLPLDFSVGTLGGCANVPVWEAREYWKTDTVIGVFQARACEDHKHWLERLVKPWKPLPGSDPDNKLIRIPDAIRATQASK